MFGFVPKQIWLPTIFPSLEKWKTIMESNVIPCLVFNIPNLVYGVSCIWICSLPAWEILIANLQNSCTQFSTEYMDLSHPSCLFLRPRPMLCNIIYLTEEKNKQIKLDFSILSGNFFIVTTKIPSTFASKPIKLMQVKYKVADNNYN